MVVGVRGHQTRLARLVPLTGNDATTSARSASRSPDTKPWARACTSTLPIAVASTGPASTGRPVASAVSWQSSVFCDCRRPRCGRPTRRRPLSSRAVSHRARERLGEALEDAAHELGPGTRAPARPCAANQAAMRAGMSPGARNRGSSASNTRHGARDGRRLRQQRRRGRCVSPSRSHSRTDSLSSHSPMTLCRKRTRPSTPPSLVKFASAARLGEHRALELDADEPPGSARDVGEVGPDVAGIGDDGGCGVVRPDGGHRRAASPRRRAAHVGSSAPSACPARRAAGRGSRQSRARSISVVVPLAASRRRPARSSRRWCARRPREPVSQ